MNATKKWAGLLPGIAGLAGLVFPFSSGYSPVSAIYEDVVPLAWPLPLFLVIAIFAWELRRVPGHPVKTSERWLAYVFGSGAMLITATTIFPLLLGEVDRFH